MHKSGETLKSLFKKGDFVVWRHWQMEYPQGAVVAGRNVLIEDRGIVLKVKKEHRSNRLSNGDLIKGLAAIEVWKAEVLFISGTRSDLPLVCLKHFGED
jgi:hypothetical protein